MGSIPPNGAVANTTRIFDGQGNVVKETTVNIPCESVPEAGLIGSECIAKVEEVKKKYAKGE